MKQHPRRHDLEIDQLMLNARLRDELEPFFDESISRLDVQSFSTEKENEFLASMLAWEKAPVLPISKWFSPELRIPSPERLGDEALSVTLAETIGRLFEKRIVLDFTDHLSDRELYLLIYRDILPSEEKKIDDRRTYLHWDCASIGDEPEMWLRYYASEEEREMWFLETRDSLPPSEIPPYSRNLPREPS